MIVIDIGKKEEEPRDAKAVQWVISLVPKEKIWMSSYLYDWFRQNGGNGRPVSHTKNNVLEKAKGSDVCFIEGENAASYADSISSFIVLKNDKPSAYPGDPWKLVQTEEINGTDRKTVVEYYGNSNGRNIVWKLTGDSTHLIPISALDYRTSLDLCNDRVLFAGTAPLKKTIRFFADSVAMYTQKTRHPVLYRVAPKYNGEELVPQSVSIKALSIDDGGKTINLDVLGFNISKDFQIDYKTGIAIPSTERSSLDKIVYDLKKKRYMGISDDGKSWYKIPETLAPKI